MQNLIDMIFIMQKVAFENTSYLYYLVVHYSRSHKQKNCSKKRGQSPCHYKSNSYFGFIDGHDC